LDTALEVLSSEIRRSDHVDPFFNNVLHDIRGSDTKARTRPAERRKKIRLRH